MTILHRGARQPSGTSPTGGHRRYAHGVDEAVRHAQALGGTALLLRPTPVAAVAAVRRGRPDAAQVDPVHTEARIGMSCAGSRSADDADAARRPQNVDLDLVATGESPGAAPEPALQLSVASTISPGVTRCVPLAARPLALAHSMLSTLVDLVPAGGGTVRRNVHSSSPLGESSTGSRQALGETPD